jgi:hypothetical protein
MYTVCAGEVDVRIVFNGRHDLQETESDNCDTTVLESIEKTFLSDTERYYSATSGKIAATVGHTRYFKCSAHCANGYNFSMTCPSTPLPPLPSPPPPKDIIFTNVSRTEYKEVSVSKCSNTTHMYVSGLVEGENYSVRLTSLRRKLQRKAHIPE